MYKAKKINIAPVQATAPAGMAAAGAVTTAAPQEAAADELMGICQQLSINESRIFYIGIQALREQLQQGVWQEILLPTASIVRLFGGNKGYYDQLKKIASRLVKKKILVGQQLCDLYKHIRFNPAQGGLFIMFNPEIRQIAEAMARSYQLDISLQQVFEFKSRYTVRLLEVFSRYMSRQHAPGPMGKDAAAPGGKASDSSAHGGKASDSSGSSTHSEIAAGSSGSPPASRRRAPAEDAPEAPPQDPPDQCLKLAIAVEDLKKLLGIPMSRPYEQISNMLD